MPSTTRPGPSWPGLLAGTLLGLAAVAAAAAPGPYTFATTAAPYGSPGIAEAFAEDAVVVGEFLYDPSLPASGTLGNGATRYDASVTSWAGAVQGHTFSDPRGYTAVGNNLPAQGGNDFLMLSAEPGLGTGTHNISGFSIAGYTLVNVRLFWIQGQLGIGDFVDSDAMPATLPTFNGRLALDFVPTASPDGPLSFVFFDGLTVTAVPEPASAALLAAGVAGLLVTVKRRRRMA